LTSIAAEDGYVGSLPFLGSSTTVCQVGPAGGYTVNDYRIVLSFDTSPLRNLPSIARAVLTITRQSATGTPGTIYVDIKAGTFGPSTILTQAAYYGLPSLSNIGTISVPSANGAASSFQLPTDALKYIQGSNSRVQIILRQIVPTTPVPSANLLQIFDGQATLIVQ